MSDNEFRFCCLYLLGVKTSVIANVLDLQPNTISKYVKDIAMKYFNSSQYDSLSENLNELASKSIFGNFILGWFVGVDIQVVNCVNKIIKSTFY